MRQSAVYFSRRCHIREVRGAACSRTMACLFTALWMLSACVTGGRPQGASVAGAEEAVRSTELAFAKAMADRDFNAFASHLSDDAVFFDDRKIQHGAAEVSAAWKPLFSDAKAPFSWAPDHVEVLAAGDLALSTGPVIVNDRVVGRFNSIWRLEAPHTWRIVFDKGEPVCTDAAK
jgi:ketosteroid isomerase-like protein